MADLEKVEVMTADGEKVDIPIDLANKCLLLKTSFIDEDYDLDQDPIPLSDVNKKILDKVIAYLEHFQTNPKIANTLQNMPLRCNKMECYFDEWVLEFFKIERNDLFELIMAANFLDIKSLFKLTGVAIA